MLQCKTTSLSKHLADYGVFTTTVDGKRVEARIEHKAILEKRDQTAVLENYQVPLPFHLAEAGLAKLPNAARDELKRLGLVGRDDQPLWTVRTTFYWQQVFPAERETVNEHRYKPSVGGTVQTSLGSSTFQRSDYFREYQRKYCVDASFVREVARVTGGGKNRFMEHWISYILTTGANWAGPIRKFRLVVDKGSPSNLVSFCADGVRKIAPTRFEVKAANFVPKTDLSILILQPAAADASKPDESLSLNDDLSSSGCDDLWYRRNAIYKAGGYCFKTPRAIAQFWQCWMRVR